jgi:hypothetical protein
MPALSQEHRKLLENTVVKARRSAVAGARKALTALRAADKESPADPDQKVLRSQLRAHGRQLGDARHPDGTQETRRLEQACAYEHWHRMLFARFLAENDLLLNPEYGVAMSLAEVQETAREKNQDWIALASDYAQRMLLEVFRPDDPVLRLTMPAEARQELEESLTQLPAEVFTANDSLGWVYQFWQREEKAKIDQAAQSTTQIEAEGISPVTQLFTEDYMVLFLLHNTLGAWWVNKRNAEGADPHLKGHDLIYLRLADNGEPLAGSFERWPKKVSEIHLLDPCMGSGHFLAFALPLLAAMRQTEEALSEKDAITAVLAENLFGLEIDPRCSQIAAFNLALTAWRYLGHPFRLPSLNLACSGIGINAPEESWTALGKDNALLTSTLGELFSTFQKASALGSLIDPTRIGRPLLAARFEEIWPKAQEALAAEQSDLDSGELAIAAKGILAAANILTKHYHLIATNVPYLGRRKQPDELKAYCKEYYTDAQVDLSTSFIDRCLRFCVEGGTAALVTPQNWLFLGSYKALRERLLQSSAWNLVVRLGPSAFQDMNWWAATTALLAISREKPATEHRLYGLDVSNSKTPVDKASSIKTTEATSFRQLDQLVNPNSVVSYESPSDLLSLDAFADSPNGSHGGDSLRHRRVFWELPAVTREWRFFQSTVESTRPYGGREHLFSWRNGGQEHTRNPNARIQGENVLGRRGVVVSMMRTLPATLYTGELFDISCTPIVPRDESNLPAIWAYCSSDEYRQAVRVIDPKVNVTNATLAKVPFDAGYWSSVAQDLYPAGLPDSESEDPTQWLFNGNPQCSNEPLQAAVARLVGYRWPRQTGSQFLDSPSLAPDQLERHADTDGVVCLASLGGEDSAANRLRRLLEAAFGSSWSAAKLNELLCGSPSLEVWLRDDFFGEHCSLFHSRPFVWHIWDGRRDGFHALVNYHRLAGPNGEGRKTLEKLIYTSLGDWITRQQTEVESGADGAEGRLAAAKHLRLELAHILNGEPPYDLFIRWKPLQEQPMGWEPDVDDGVRLNMRPWLHARPYESSKRDACILRATPIKLPLGTDRGKESIRDREDFPWFATSQDRTNDEHFTLEQKRAARERNKRS